MKGIKKFSPIKLRYFRMDYKDLNYVPISNQVSAKVPPAILY